MKIQILIVEDNPDMVHMHQNILDHWGYGSIVAKNGKEAVDMAASQLPDLILLDIMLPNMDGLEAAAKVSPEDREKCLQNGCNDYLSKPFTPKELLSKIKKLLM